MAGTVYAGQTKATLQAYIRRLDDIKDILLGAIKSMDLHKVDQTQVGYFTKTDEALDKVRDFANDAVKAVEEARKKRGNFGVLETKGGVPGRAGKFPGKSTIKIKKRPQKSGVDNGGK